MDILGVKLDNFTRKEVLAKVTTFLAEDRFHQIATINPEFILRAQKDVAFRDILNDCDLKVVDGVGIWFAFLRFGKYLKSRMTGIDLMMEILKLASENKLKVFLISYDGALSSWEETKVAILKIHPNLEIDGELLDTGCPMDIKNERHSVSKAIADYEIVFCSLGTPSQEKLLHSLKTVENAKIRLVMGVGGSFDFLTGKCKRAPKFLQKIGLEWLWRFLQEPKYRAKRIFRAVIVFPIKIIFN
jgi:N-acetylglucosaminyldiphosphoundecaprenol N-acetyl-beta-D-mannosaminyltransferase